MKLSRKAADRVGGKTGFPSLFGESPAEPMRVADVTLRMPTGERVTWKLTHTARAWEAQCPFCGKSSFLGTEAVRPSALRCWKCGTWLPTP